MFILRTYPWLFVVVVSSVIADLWCIILRTYPWLFVVVVSSVVAGLWCCRWSCGQYVQLLIYFWPSLAAFLRPLTLPPASQSKHTPINLI